LVAVGSSPRPVVIGETTLEFPGPVLAFAYPRFGHALQPHFADGVLPEQGAFADGAA